MTHLRWTDQIINWGLNGLKNKNFFHEKLHSKYKLVIYSTKSDIIMHTVCIMLPKPNSLENVGSKNSIIVVKSFEYWLGTPPPSLDKEGS